MKYRMPPALWTDEDDAIWHWVQRGWFGYLVGRSMELDRREADLILKAQLNPHHPYCSSRGAAINMRGRRRISDPERDR